MLLEGPFGRFTADQARSAKTLLVAGGAGIGPIRSLAEDLVLHGRDVVVLHRAHSPAGLALSRELVGCAALRYVALPGRRAEIGYDPLSPQSLKQLVPDMTDRDVFVCGPEGLVSTVVRSAHALGVARGSIHYEELSLS